MTIYDGTLDYKKMKKSAQQGYFSFRNQKSRCNSKTHPQYSHYGAKGCRVHYTMREFVGWWIANLKTKKWKAPTVGRIDHSLGYSFDNIEMQERADNTREVHKRLGQCGGVDERKVEIRKDGKTQKFPSTRAAARWLKTSQSNIIRYCQGSVARPSLGFEARYL